MGRNDEFVADFDKEPTVIMPMMENWKKNSQISVPKELPSNHIAVIASRFPIPPAWAAKKKSK
jgi:hypothetical protein